MKLLFDENLSPRLLNLLAADFPGSAHLENLNMRGATDAAVWAYARDIRTFDEDPEQSLLPLELKQ